MRASEGGWRDCAAAAAIGAVATAPPPLLPSRSGCSSSGRTRTRLGRCGSLSPTVPASARCSAVRISPSTSAASCISRSSIASPSRSPESASRSGAGLTSQLAVPRAAAAHCDDALSLPAAAGRLGACHSSSNTPRSDASTAASAAGPRGAPGGSGANRRARQLGRCHSAWMMTFRKQLYCPSSLRRPRISRRPASNGGPCSGSNTQHGGRARRHTQRVRHIVAWPMCAMASRRAQLCPAGASTPAEAEAEAGGVPCCWLLLDGRGSWEEWAHSNRRAWEMGRWDCAPAAAASAPRC